MGLVQRAIEAAGIPTIGITLQKEVTRRVRPPRALYLRYPFATAQQRTILTDALRALESLRVPGEIVEPGYRWKRHRFE